MIHKLWYIKENVDISFLSTFKTSAVAKYYFEILTEDDIRLLPEIIRYAQEAHLPVALIAWGSNCLFAFDTFEGIIVRNRYGWYSEPYDRDGKMYINVHSGEMSTNLAIRLYQNYSLSTLVPWTGLPGTIGGAAIGNAGCFGLEMSDMFVSARVLDIKNNVISTYTKQDMCYEYRGSILKGDQTRFIIDITLDISPKWWEYESYTPANLQSLRKLKQPPGFSCGSFFKNPPVNTPIIGREWLLGEREHYETWSAGKLIDEAWLKLSRVGGVHVSERHANFVVNDKHGTWQDILQLRDRLKANVWEKFGIELEEEVRIIQNTHLHRFDDTKGTY